MAIIKKVGDKYRYFISHTVNGVQKQYRKSGFKTIKEAKIAAAEVELNLSKGIIPHLKLEPFDNYFDNWVKLYKSKLSGSTKYNYQYTLKAIKGYFGNTPLQKIKRHDYQAFLNEFGSTKSRETVEKVHSHIRACVQDAREEEIVRHDFTRKAKLTWTVQSKKPNEKHLNFNESQMLINTLFKNLDQGLIYYLILLGLTTGLRFSELVGLTTKDFDFHNNTINIEKTWGYMKRSELGFGKTKNEKSNRIIKVDIRTMVAFRNLFKVMPSNLNHLVFYNQNSKYKVISNTTANNMLKKLLSELNIESITMHGLRHTHASVLLYKNVSIHYVSERLGHSDIDTTLKKYAHLLTEKRIEDEQETIKIFNQMVV